MNRWAFVVAFLYALMLGVLTLPFSMLAFVPTVSLSQGASVYLEWQWWLWLLVMGLAQFALLALPVRVASRRPVSRRPLALTVLVAALMMCALIAGAAGSVFEFIYGEKQPEINGRAAVAVAFVVWAAWALIFFRMSRRADPAGFSSRLANGLMKGSILELFIAVPTHIVARSRDYCCAGIMTFVGLVLGFSVMLFSFGPGVFFLFVARWRRLHPEPNSPPQP